MKIQFVEITLFVIGITSYFLPWFIGNGYIEFFGVTEYIFTLNGVGQGRLCSGDSNCIRVIWSLGWINIVGLSILSIMTTIDIFSLIYPSKTESIMEQKDKIFLVLTAITFFLGILYVLLFQANMGEMEIRAILVSVLNLNNFVEFYHLIYSLSFGFIVFMATNMFALILIFINKKNYRKTPISRGRGYSVIG